MNDPQTTFPAPGMTLGDVYYVLFRHKWKILLCALTGLLAALVVYEFYPPPFQSEAKLSFVMSPRADAGRRPGMTRQTKSPDQGGETIINSELQILTSLDLARQVAEVIGPEKILAKAGRRQGSEHCRGHGPGEISSSTCRSIAA